MSGFPTSIHSYDGAPGTGAREIPRSPATDALIETQETMLLALHKAISRHGKGDSDELPIAELIRTLSRIAGSFRFCGAHNLDMLCGLMHDVLQNSGAGASSAAIFQALDSACSELTRCLQLIRQGRGVPAGRLFAVWRELGACLPGPAPSVSALISLDLATESDAGRAAEASLRARAASAVTHAVAIPAIDEILLDLLRADAGSTSLSDSLRALGAVLSAVHQNVHDARDRLYWAVMLVYSELLACDAPMDVTLAKKNLSAAIQVIRQSARQSLLSAARLPDRLMREVLLQIGLFAPVMDISQSVRDVFALDWQLSPNSEPMDISFIDGKKHPLLAHFDELELEWAHAELRQRRRQIEAIADLLQAIPALASMADSLRALVVFEKSLDLWVAGGLLITRLAVEDYLGQGITPPFFRFAKALEAIASQTDPVKASERQCWDILKNIAPRLQYFAATNELRNTAQSVLRETEQALDLMFESGDSVAALREMISSLDRAAGALTLVDAKAAIQLTESLRHSLRLAVQAATPEGSGVIADDVHTLALQWVQLCDVVQAWSPDDSLLQAADDFSVATIGTDMSAVSVHRQPAAVHQSFSEPASSLSASSDCISDAASNEETQDTRLEQIFIDEATQRLSLLRQALSGWIGSTAEVLPAAIANEAHGLAGSSATVGRQRLHEGALALEQVVNYLAKLPAARQHAHADDLLQAVLVLEHEVRSVRDHRTELFHSDDPVLASALSALLLLPQRLAADAHDVLPVDTSSCGAIEQTLSLHLAPDTPQTSSPDILAMPGRQDIVGLPAMVTQTCSDDAELLAVFSEEAAELLPLLAQQMDDWLTTPQDDSLRSGVLRLLHTLKGSARMAGQMVLGERLHRMEHDVSQLARTAGEPGAHDLRHELAQMFAEAGLASQSPLPSVSAELSALSASLPEQGVPERSATEFMSAMPRLRIDLLERASGSAAELLVGTVRTTEALQRQRQTLSELGDNLVRLRTQLRELEMQSESRITAQAQPSVSTFDPLEFDRYTRLQELTRMTAESLADLTSLQRTLARQADSAVAVLSQQTRYARSLQSDLRRASMQAFSGIESRLRHLVRQVAAETGREVHFELDGAQVEIDRHQLDRLSSALQHLIRNAIVHGIEAPSEREQAGKPRSGVVRLSLGQQGGELRLQISDDGRGLDLSRIYARACELGVLDAGAVVDDAQLAEMIFHPGLSTADEVTGLAGRGIGMDVVREIVMQMGGALKVDSLHGAGTCITLGLPQLLSTQQVLVVAEGSDPIALPASMVQQLMQPDNATLYQANQEGSIEWQRQTMPLRSLRELLGLSAVPVSASSV